MKRVFLFIFLALTFIATATSQSTSEFFECSELFFKENVKNGRVDYKKIKSNPSTLDKLLKMAQHMPIDDKNKKVYQAFWVNGYNLLVIKGVIDNYPLKSPLDVKGFFDQQTYTIGGETLTLNQVEHQLLKDNYTKDPRFHFVLVCAGLGCPPIIDEAYTPTKLSEQLDRQTKKALNDPEFIRVSRNKVEISQIFDWYSVDFEKNGDVIDFINTYRTDKLPESLKVAYYSYDWALNDLK